MPLASEYEQHGGDGEVAEFGDHGSDFVGVHYDPAIVTAFSTSISPEVITRIAR